VQLAGHPQPGLVEPGDIGLGDLLFHGAEDAAEPVGGAFGHRRDSALRDRGARTGRPSLAPARFFDRNCPTYRYSTIAVMRGPYWTGATSATAAAAHAGMVAMLDEAVAQVLEADFLQADWDGDG
jgi:hypothetical protein